MLIAIAVRREGLTSKEARTRPVQAGRELRPQSVSPVDAQVVSIRQVRRRLPNISSGPNPESRTAGPLAPSPPRCRCGTLELILNDLGDELAYRHGGAGGHRTSPCTIRVASEYSRIIPRPRRSRASCVSFSENSPESTRAVSPILRAERPSATRWSWFIRTSVQKESNSISSPCGNIAQTRGFKQGETQRHIPIPRVSVESTRRRHRAGKETDNVIPPRSAPLGGRHKFLRLARV